MKYRKDFKYNNQTHINIGGLYTQESAEITNGIIRGRIVEEEFLFGLVKLNRCYLDNGNTKQLVSGPLMNLVHLGKKNKSESIDDFLDKF